jgi:arsenate reductase
MTNERERGSRSDRFRVLFVCTHNSARSQIAEALLRRQGGDRFEVASAGSEPSGAVNDIALEMIADVGGDPAQHRSKGLDEVLDREWDLVVTVCDHARESCPLVPARRVSAHWGIPDPSALPGSRSDRLTAFRSATARLATRITRLVALSPFDLSPAELQKKLQQIHQADPQDV